MSLYERAAILPGRSMTCSKQPGRFWPIGAAEHYCVGGDGCELIMADGSRLIDMLCALGAISIGYGANRQVFEDAEGVYSVPHSAEVEAAEAVLKTVAPWASWVKFTKTGSEATHAAYRIAKKVTNRTAVIKGDWAYHGWHEWCHRAPTYSHGQTLSEVLPSWPCWDGSDPWDEVAAVFIEPHRWEHVDQSWLRSVRDWCDRTGALLVFDSMIYGGRFHLQGSSGFFGIKPDLETFGKAYGNGASVAFVVGQTKETREAAEMVSGTYSGCVTGMQAVINTLHTYQTQPVIDTLWARGQQLWDGIAELQRDDIHLEGNPVHQRFRFDDKATGHRFSDEMRKRGVLWLPDCQNIMYAHEARHIDHVIGAAAESVKALR